MARSELSAKPIRRILHVVLPSKSPSAPRGLAPNARSAEKSGVSAQTRASARILAAVLLQPARQGRDAAPAQSIALRRHDQERRNFQSNRAKRAPGVLPAYIPLSWS